MELPENVEILPSALREAMKAVRWYALRSPQLADRFLEKLQEAINKISDGPDRWPRYSRRTRFLKLRRFPYVLYFTTAGNQSLIVAVAHTSRRPGYWRWRL